MPFKGKVALITGAGSGIGKATALLLAQEGVRVAALSRSDDEIKATVQEISDQGGEAFAVCADIGNAAAMQSAVKQIIERWERLDIVFANAGINGVWAPIEQLTPEEWEQTLRINLTGTFLTIKYAVPYLKQRGGSVVMTASVNGTRIFSNTGATAYSTTKAGQLAMTKMLALELAAAKIRVNVICPGAIETSIDDNTEQRNLDQIKIPVEFPNGNQPLTGKPGSAEQVAKLVRFLASDDASHISGTEVWIDGAESLLIG